MLSTEGNLKATISRHQLDQIVVYIQREYDTFGVQKSGNKTILDHLAHPTDLLVWAPKPITSFKNIIWPNHHVPGHENAKRKIAFLGLTNCDAQALEIFLDQFSRTEFLPPRQNIFIMTSECKPDETCFCSAFGQPKYTHSDLHIQENSKKIDIFALSDLGEKILQKNGVEKLDPKTKVREIIKQNVEKFDLRGIAAEIDDKDKHIDYWQNIAKNCFGCGACTAVCPLCFCFRQDFENKTDGSCNQCTSWDSCFAKSFSTIVGHNFRPKNSDRLYNWYHHKFCRSIHNTGQPLCTGCGRCIAACPAHLNQHSITQGVTKHKK